MTRRRFARSLAAATLLTPFVRADETPRLRAAIIGHTGRGDFGHGLDIVFNNVPGIEVVAVADPDASGRAKVADRTGARVQYADYRELLEKERPQLVCHASRWSEHRRDVAIAALRIGAHLLTEKPFVGSLAEADEILALAEKGARKIAVAHQMRLAPSIVALRDALRSGLIGELLQVRAWGKQDAARAGGEDMIVLGSHLFDLIRLFAGDPIWCSARVLHDGHEITRADAREVKEQIGPVAGNDIHAHFAFPNGINATFISNTKLRETLGPWGMELLGSKGSVRILTEVFPSIHLQKPGNWQNSGRHDEWVRWEGDPGAKLAGDERGFGPANRRVVNDLLAAIAEKRDPICSARNATQSIEMNMAVYQAALNRSRVPLPLPERKHPLAG